MAGTRLRDRVVASLGEGPYLGLFSLASAAGLAGMVLAYRAAPYLPSWGLWLGWRWAMLPLMLVAMLLAAIGLLTPNPTAFGQERRIAAKPTGILRVTRHPFLMGVALWALLHLIGNGDWASFV
ncbi:MAG: NnrU family protein, partial [Stellaceae bacterium]